MKVRNLICIVLIVVLIVYRITTEQHKFEQLSSEPVQTSSQSEEIDSTSKPVSSTPISLKEEVIQIKITEEMKDQLSELSHEQLQYKFPSFSFDQEEEAEKVYRLKYTRKQRRIIREGVYSIMNSVHEYYKPKIDASSRLKVADPVGISTLSRDYSRDIYNARMRCMQTYNLSAEEFSVCGLEFPEDK